MRGGRFGWESNLEFDSIHSVSDASGRQRLIVSEVKWKRLTTSERTEITQRLAQTWAKSALHNRYPYVDFEVIDATVLKTVRRERTEPNRLPKAGR
jgi:hypothetical protein